MLGLISAVAALTASASPFVRKPCADLQVAARAQCGSFRVAEDRSFPTGRQIALNVIIIPAAKPAKDRQALFDLDGGPGLADTKNASFYTTAGATYAASRDVVLIDQRGTGGSNPLDCPEFEKADRALEPMFPAAAVRSCRVRIGRSADLTSYTTEDSVEDLEAVRRSLGYTKIDLFALSYGTTLALRYIADHGANVRSAVLLSAVPPSAMPPRYGATSARSVDGRLPRRRQVPSEISAAPHRPRERPPKDWFREADWGPSGDGTSEDETLLAERSADGALGHSPLVEG